MKKRSSRTVPKREGDSWAGRSPGSHNVKVALEFHQEKKCLDSWYVASRKCNVTAIGASMEWRKKGGTADTIMSSSF